MPVEDTVHNLTFAAVNTEALAAALDRQVQSLHDSHGANTACSSTVIRSTVRLPADSGPIAGGKG